MAKKSIFREDKKDGAERVLPDPKDVLGLPILADMQFGKWKGGEDVIRVFYRYRGKDVPELIVKEREKLRAKAIEAGRIPAEYPEVRLYLGIVEDLVFHPKSDFTAHPEKYPEPHKSNRGRRKAKIESEITGLRGREFARLNSSDASYNLSCGATAALMYCMKANGSHQDFYDALNEVLPGRAEDLFHPALTLVLFMAQTGEAAWKLDEWSVRRLVPCQLTGPRASEIFHEIGLVHDQLKEAYVRRRIARFKLEPGDMFALDGTNAPCAAQKIGLAYVGKGKEGALQRQIVISYLYSANRGEPITYEVFPGNMPDVSSLGIYRDLWTGYGLTPRDAVNIFDRGFFKTEELKQWILDKTPFIVGVRTNCSFVKKAIRSVEGLHSRKYQMPGSSICGTVVNTRLDDKDPNSEVFLHLYWNPEVYANVIQKFDADLADAKAQWNLGRGKLPAAMKPYFEKPVKDQPLVENIDAIDEEYKLAGYFAFVSNKISNCRMCLARYGLRNGVEVCFKTAKSATGISTLRVHNDVTLLGKVFLNFLAVTTASTLLARMKNWHRSSRIESAPTTPISRKMGYQKLLNELDAAFLFKHVKRTPGVHHETEKISNLLEQLGMPDVLSNTQKLIDMVTGFPPSADASP